MTKWDRWFYKLIRGDEVLIHLPWDDGGKARAGGRIVKATVGNCWIHSKTFHYRNRYGTRLYAPLRSWTGDCYHHVMPLTREIVYSPKRGYMMAKRPLGYHLKRK
jgi:hypothetical protein